MKFRSLLLAALAGILLFTSSCTKTGPQGPPGPTGATGNANVIGSDHITVSNWEISGNGYSATFTYGDITSAVANYGLVEIYKQYNDGSWTNLPDINNGVSTVYNFSSGTFTIYVYNIDGSLSNYPGTINFRLVIIPSSLRQANPNANWKNYEETMSILEKAHTDATN